VLLRTEPCQLFSLYEKNEKDLALLIEDTGTVRTVVYRTVFLLKTRVPGLVPKNKSHTAPVPVPVDLER
jgi:hypothetical protein